MKKREVGKTTKLFQQIFGTDLIYECRAVHIFVFAMSTNQFMFENQQTGRKLDRKLSLTRANFGRSPPPTQTLVVNIGFRKYFFKNKAWELAASLSLLKQFISGGFLHPMILDDKGLPEMMMVLHHNWDKGEVMISLQKCEGWIVGVWGLS